MTLVRQLLLVDQYAVLFHGEKNAFYRQLQVAIGGFQAGFFSQTRQNAFGNAQRDVGILGRISGGIGHSRLIKTDLGGPFAADSFVGNRAHAQVTAGQCAQLQGAGANLPSLQHVSGEQCVVHNTGQRNAMVGKYVLIILGVLQNLAGRAVFEPGLQAGQRAIKGAVPGYPGRCVPEADRPLHRAQWQTRCRPDALAAHLGWLFPYPVRRVRLG